MSASHEGDTIYIVGSTTDGKLHGIAFERSTGHMASSGKHSHVTRPCFIGLCAHACRMLSGSVLPSTPVVAPVVVAVPLSPLPIMVAACTAACEQLASIPLTQLARSDTSAAGNDPRLQYTPLTSVGSQSLLPSEPSIGPLALRTLSGGLLALETQGNRMTAAVVASAPRGSSFPWRLAASWPSQGGAAVDAFLNPDTHVTADVASPPVLLAALHLSDGNESVVLTVTDPATGAVQASETYAEWLPKHHGGMPAVLHAATFARRNGGRGYRALVTGADDSVALLQQSRLAWLREESLASIIEAVFVEPPSGAVGGHGDGCASGNHVKSLALTVGHALEAVLSQPLRALMSRGGVLPAGNDSTTRGPPSPVDWPQVGHTHRDEHGFHRIIIALTTAGKVLALRSSDGGVLWTWMPTHQGAGNVPTALFLWRSGPSPLVLLATRQPQAGATRLEWLDAHTGASAGSAAIPVTADRLVPTPCLDGAGRRVLLLWQLQPVVRVVVFPPGQEDAVLASGVSLVHTSGTGLQGYTLALQSPSSQVATPVLTAFPSWSLTLARPEVLATAQRQAAEDVVFSVVRVTGDRAQQHKFVSHNTLLVAAPVGGGALQTADALHPGQQLDAPTAIEVVVLDTVTGRVLYRVRHAGVTGPVHAVATDNAFVYSYWSTAGQRTEVSVLELLLDTARIRQPSLGEVVLAALAPGAVAKHGNARSTAGTWTGTSGGGSSGASSLAPPALRVLGQSYTLHGRVAAMGVARTRRGLAARQVLLATTGGRLVALDRRFLDPRRPTKPSAADREEGLVPYAEALPLLPGAYVTAFARVSRLACVRSAPATLESASHVLASGLDVFYARTAPSRTFDTLGDDFSRSFLVVTLAVLTLAAGAAARAADKDSVARQWM